MSTYTKNASPINTWTVLPVLALGASYLFNTAPPAYDPNASLWDRMGGESVIKPLCNDLYDLHASDPITAPWFGKENAWNIRTADEVKEHVFTFFSAGIGGPHKYEGRSMIEAHKKMAELKPLTKTALHALINHVPTMMKKHRAGGDRELDEVVNILYSLVPDVSHYGVAEHEPTDESLYDRMGGEEVLRPLCNELYDLHASDPLTKDWFTPSSAWNIRTAEQVKENVFTFFSSGIGGPHKYEGRSMIEAHAAMRDLKPFTKTAFHALLYHVMAMMNKYDLKERETDEVLAILESLRSHVVEGKE